MFEYSTGMGVSKSTKEERIWIHEGGSRTERRGKGGKKKGPPSFFQHFQPPINPHDYFHCMLHVVSILFIVALLNLNNESRD